MKTGTPNFRGERLREAREARGLNGVEMAELLGVTRQTISLYEHGETSPSPAVMDMIALKLRMPLDYFLFDASWPTPRPRFMRSMATTAKAARVRAERRFDWLVGLGRYLESLVKMPTPNLPQLDVPSRLDDITDEFIETTAQSVRRHWKLGDGPISNVAWLLENHGVVVGQSRLWAEKLDATSDWDDDISGRPYFLLGLDKRSAVRSRFDAAHELGHAVLHRNIERADMFKSAAVFRAIETQAHRFAGAFLLPAESFESEFFVPTLESLLRLKPRWLTSVGMMVMRGEHLGLISEEQGRFLQIGISRKKWRDKEPYDDSIPCEQPRLLKRAIEMLVDGGIQTRAQVAASIKVPAADLEELANLTPGYLAQAPDIVSIRHGDNGTVIQFPPKKYPPVS